MAYRIVKSDDIKKKQNLIKNEDVLNLAVHEEREFLSLLLNHRDLMDDVIKNTNINDDYFFYLENARIFAIAAFYHLEHNSALTEGAVNEIVRNSKHPQEERAILQRLMKPLSKPEEYERLKNNLIDRHNQQLFYEMVFEGKDGDVGIAHRILNATSNQTAIISEFQDKIMSFEKRLKSDEFTTVTSLSESVERVVKSIADRRVNPEKHYGWLTGYKGIDNVIYGMRPGKYGLVIGYPNGGKTTFMINLALGFAAHGAKVCYVTVESSDDEIAERMLCNLAMVSSETLKKGGAEITSKIYADILKAKEKIKESFGESFVFITVPQKTPVNDVISLIDRKRRSTNFNVVFVDYLDVIDSIERFPGRPDLEIGQVSMRLQAYGKKHNLSMISAQSFNNETIKLIKKVILNAKDGIESITDDIGAAIGPDSVGGSQKLSRDCDYMWGLILGNKKQRLAIYWMKSRDSGKPEPFFLTAKLDCCKLIEEEHYDITTLDENQDELLDAFIERNRIRKEKEEEENSSMLSNADKVIAAAQKVTIVPANVMGTVSDFSVQSGGEKIAVEETAVEEGPVGESAVEEIATVRDDDNDNAMNSSENM